MEYAIDQSLKIYAGGLGYLAGSYMRSAYELHQNVTGIGILWKYGYYDQGRKQDQTMDVVLREKSYRFLTDTGIRFKIKISGCDVWVAAFYLSPELFKTAPLFLLSTDLPENDYLARTTSYQLYHSNPETQAAAAILLGAGGAELLEILGWQPAIYHLNESHALPLIFRLFRKYGSVTEVRKKVVFTNHTPEPGGNPRTDIHLMHKMGFAGDMTLEQFKAITQAQDDILDHTLTALRFSGRANAVSRLHLGTLKTMWKGFSDSCEIISITNGQSYSYWADVEMYEALASGDVKRLNERKKYCKKQLFAEVADQCGIWMDAEKLTIVFAKRFTDYKRAELLLHDMEMLTRLLTNKERPVQIIWAGKPYPMDYTGIASFDKLVNITRSLPNTAVLSGYELKLSRLLKQGADVWLNTPRRTHEASGTSGMSAAMNGCVNVSVPDGWFPEFADDKVNSFIIPDKEVPEHKFQQDETDAHNLYQLLDRIVTTYYDHPVQWTAIIKNSMRTVIPQFDSNRMVDEYYMKLYNL